LNDINDHEAHGHTKPYGTATDLNASG